MPGTPLIPPPVDAHTLTLIQLAVREDLGPVPPATAHGDLTVELTIPEGQVSSATIVARKPGTIAGTHLLEPILHAYAAEGPMTILTPDGSRVTFNQPVATITAPSRALLSAERVLLNFLSHLSGIATMTRRYVDAIADIQAANDGRPVITDTRKTTPGFRALDKYAVRCGGGVNHRMGIYDGVMLKDNHLVALRERLGEGGQGTLAQITAHIRVKLDPAIPLWLEVDTLAQLAEALHQETTVHGADIILLDNFTPDQLRKAVQLRNTRPSFLNTQHLSPLLEASGGITLDNIREVASISGIDRIAIGAITHSAPILDLSMEFS